MVLIRVAVILPQRRFVRIHAGKLLLIAAVLGSLCAGDACSVGPPCSITMSGGFVPDGVVNRGWRGAWKNACAVRGAPSRPGRVAYSMGSARETNSAASTAGPRIPAR